MNSEDEPTLEEKKLFTALKYNVTFEMGGWVLKRLPLDFLSENGICFRALSGDIKFTDQAILRFYYHQDEYRLFFNDLIEKLYKYEQDRS